MLSVEIDYDDDRWETLGSDLCDHLSTAAKTAVELSDWQALGNAERSIEISLLLSHDSVIQELNKTYRGRDKSTNVLSFPASPPDERLVDLNKDAAPPLLLGDIIISYETLIKEAQAQSKSAVHHVLHLMVHGTLHLLDYDHIEDDDAEVMEQLERQILTRLGVHDPYAPVVDAIKEQTQ